MQIELKHLHEKLGVTTVYVTHDQREALTMSDRIAVINDGKLAQVDTPHAIYNRPANQFVADFIGESTMLPLTRDDSGRLLFENHVIAVDYPTAPEGGYFLVIRPERLFMIRDETVDLEKTIEFSSKVREFVFQGESAFALAAISEKHDLSFVSARFDLVTGEHEARRLGVARPEPTGRHHHPAGSRRMNPARAGGICSDDLNEESLRTQGVREQRMLLSLATPAVVLIIVIILIPVGWLFYLSFIGNDGQFSLEHYQKMIAYKSYARVFVTTFQVSILTTVLCILIGYPLAYFLAILPARIAGFFMLAVLLPFWTSLLVRTYAWLVLLQKNGILNDFAISVGLWDTPVKLVHNMTGTLIGMAHIMLPFSFCRSTARCARSSVT